MPTKQQYRTTIYLGIIDGKKIRKTIRAKSKKELNKKVAEERLKLNSSHNSRHKVDNTFGNWSKRWMDEYKYPLGLCEGTLVEYQSAINHLNSRFEDYELEDITLSEFQCLINDLSIKNPNTGRPTAKRTLENIVKVASGIFRYASSNNVQNVPRFFREVVIPKKAPQSKRRALTFSEQQMIINTPHRCQIPAMIMMFAGLRRSELIPLLWSDIDLDNGYILITKSVNIQGNNMEIKQGGKTENATRKVAIPQILIDYLAKFRPKNKPESLVCTNTRGKMHSVSSFRKMWESYLIELNIKYGYENRNINKFNPKKLPMKIERFTPHYLRHTYATILYLQGINMVSAKQYLGHSDIKTTINIYTDLDNNSFLDITNSYKKALNSNYKIKTTTEYLNS